jgi:hypothetical protein
MGSQLVSYSGFSNTNYIREPYSSDLDFGTGEWSVSAWVNTLKADPDANFCSFPEALNSSAMSGITYTAAGTTNPVNGNITANQLVATNGTTGTPTFGFPYTIVPFTMTEPYGVTISLYVKSKGSIKLRYYADYVESNAGIVDYDIISGSVISTTNALLAPTITAVQGNPGWFRITARISIIGRFQPKFYFSDASGSFTFTGDDVTGIYAYGLKYNSGYSAGAYTPGKTAIYVPVPGVRAFSRSFSSGTSIDLAINGYGQLVASAYDGTNPVRTVTSTTSYNTGTWLKVRANYTTDGTLSLLVNGQKVNSTTGTPLLTLNNPNAVLTIGNSYNLDAPFPGSLALVKLSGTVPTPEQSLWAYEQEKQLFRSGANCTLPDSSSLVGMTYDDKTDRWIAASATNVSRWNGLVRTDVTPNTSISNIYATSGTELIARTSVGVDIAQPAVNFKTNLKADYSDSTIKPITTVDYDAVSFTATFTSGSNQLTSVASIVGTPIVGMGIGGNGIPFGTTITAISGTTYTISANTTTSGTAATISQTDYSVPIGYSTISVYVNGVEQREGSTKSFTRLYDGFKETIRLVSAPGASAWIQLHTIKE